MPWSSSSVCCASRCRAADGATSRSRGGLAAVSGQPSRAGGRIGHVGIAVLGTTAIDGAGPLAARERRVLAALVLDAPDAVPPDRLAEAVWGADLPPSWVKVVQNAVWRLRRALGDDAIGTGPGGYRLDVPPEEIDIHRFE